MKTEIQNSLATALAQVAKQHQILPENLQPNVEVERARDPEHGDFASNLAMKNAKAFGMNPRQLAEAIIAAVPTGNIIEKLEIAGPGFINIHLSKASATAVLENIITQREAFGTHQLDKPYKVLVEFVSANPTGPLHVGHGRGAAYGDSLANLLKANGQSVDKEYYVNDAGRQMDILALSVYWRYLQQCERGVALPKGIYQGEYVIQIADSIKATHGDSLVHEVKDWVPQYPEEWTDAQIDNGDRDRWIDSAIIALKAKLGTEKYAIVFDSALNAEVEDIRQDLEEFGVTFDRWYSEKSLFTNGMIDKTLERLEKAGYIYEKNGAKWFTAKQFGDEKDRVVRRENGVTTYFASDISYHLDKYERGYDHMIDIFGADHHGYMARVRAALSALNLNPEKLSIPLVQFAVLYKDGEKMQMSTRSGQFVTLRDLREMVGSDAARFFYVMRKPEQHLDFDLDLATSNSKDNPFYYVEYAHARTCRVLERAIEEGIGFDETAGLAARHTLVEAEETALITELRRYPELVKSAGAQLAPHMIVNYLKDLASAWHQFYDAGHKVLHEDDAIRNARLLLTTCVRQVLRNGLTIVGVSARERM